MITHLIKGQRNRNLALSYPGTVSLPYRLLFNVISLVLSLEDPKLTEFSIF